LSTSMNSKKWPKERIKQLVEMFERSGVSKRGGIVFDEIEVRTSLDLVSRFM